MEQCETLVWHSRVESAKRFRAAYTSDGFGQRRLALFSHECQTNAGSAAGPRSWTHDGPAGSRAVVAWTGVGGSGQGIWAQIAKTRIVCAVSLAARAVPFQ